VNKYLVTALSAMIGEIASTLYISSVSEKSILMLLMAFIGPFIGLPFAGYMVETKTWSDRIKLSFAMGIGYFIGAFIVYVIIKNAST